MTMRERMSEWWRPTLAVPTLGEPTDPVSERADVSPGQRAAVGSPSARLSALFGCTDAIGSIVVTPRGVEIPIGNAHGWTVLGLAALIAEIDDLPEIEPGSLRA